MKKGDGSVNGIFGLDVAGNVEEVHLLPLLPLVDPPAPEPVGPQLVLPAQPVALLVVLLAQHREVDLKLGLPEVL